MNDLFVLYNVYHVKNQSNTFNTCMDSTSFIVKTYDHMQSGGLHIASYNSVNFLWRSEDTLEEGDRPVRRGGSGGSVEPPFLKKKNIYIYILKF